MLPGRDSAFLPRASSLSQVRLRIRFQANVRGARSARFVSLPQRYY
jgi:hypothetical protein